MQNKLIWSRDHQAYWSAGLTGYTTDAAKAGLYPEDLAQQFIRTANAENRFELRDPPEYVLKATPDDPDLDGTDGAHPAWWRGHEQSTAMLCARVTDILDGKDDGAGANYEPWGTVRRRLLALVGKTTEPDTGPR